MIPKEERRTGSKTQFISWDEAGRRRQAAFLAEGKGKEVSWPGGRPFQVLLRLAEYLWAGAYGLLLLERCNMGGQTAVLTWLKANPGLMLLSFVVLCGIYGLIRLWFRRPLVPVTIYGSLIFLISTANYYKVLYRNEPLTPYDLFNIEAAADIAGNMNMTFDVGLRLNLLCLLISLVIFGIIQVRLFHSSPGKRLPMGLGAFLAWGALLFYLCNTGHLAGLGVTDVRFDQLRNYQENGFALSTLMNLADSGIKKPPNYGQAALVAARAEIMAAPTAPVLGAPAKLPHIIVIQMEAYGDPRLIDPRIDYHTDPFQPLDAYREEIKPFHTLASIIGGGTANTEFEFLTGYNMYFCPPGVTPFIRYVHKERAALPWDLADLGYTTVAMHPNSGSFYNRQEVYPNLGFQEFITLVDFQDPAYVGYYVSDAAFGSKVKDIFEEMHEEGPLFFFAVSIQNHGPYSYPEIYRNYPLTTTGGLILEETQVRELETFGANLYDSSRMLADLLGYFSQVDEPVLLLIYGDHQAAWSWARNLAGGPEREWRKYATESFFWANYPLSEDTKELISASGLAPELLKRAGLGLSLYFKGIDLQFQEILAYNVAVIIDQKGQASYVTSEAVEQFQLIQYDRIFGKKYLESTKGWGPP